MHHRPTEVPAVDVAFDAATKLTNVSFSAFRAGRYWLEGPAGTVAIVDVVAPPCYAGRGAPCDVCPPGAAMRLAATRCPA